MTSAVATLLASMAEKLQRSDLAICQTLSNALGAGGRNDPYIPPLSPQHAQKSLDYIARACPDSSSGNILMIQQCASYLSWRQPGFGHVPQAVAKHLAVCEIIGPTGQITHDNIRAGLFFQDADILYPRHSHAAEEIYLPLSGFAAWQASDDDWRLQAPGDIIHHLPFQPHAINTKQLPLLAFWGWADDIGADSYRI